MTMSDVELLFLNDPFTKTLEEKLTNTRSGRELWEIIDNQALATYFQPVLDLKRKEILGYEALLRGPQDSNFQSPMAILNLAMELGCLFEVDLLVRCLAIIRFYELSKDLERQPLLFLNISVNSLMEGHHRGGMTLECIEKTGLSVDNVVIEITEHQPVPNHQDFLDALNHYRKKGFKIALDDLGGGYNGLRIWAEIHPEFVKIDKHFTSKIHKSREKTKFMETIANLAGNFGSRVIAEGVETEKELSALDLIGIEFVQGYLFKKPKPKLVQKLDFDWRRKKIRRHNSETVESLVQNVPTVSSQLTVRELTDLLHSNADWDYLPVVDDEKVEGIIWRKELMDLLARRYVPELLQRKSVSKVMDHNPIVVDVDTPLVELSRLITNDADRKVSLAFVITENGKYAGCGTFFGLLRTMTDLKVRNAQYANPLSGLPGNVPIQNTLKDYLSQEAEFVVMYIDVNHFKPYNDYYSFEQGDDVITTIANILKSVSYSDDIFVGHVGGDDFMMIFPFEIEYTELCEAILDQFAKNIPMFYNKEDVERGGIKAVNRSGQEEFFAMMSLSIGVLVANPSRFRHTQELSSFATKAKKLSKAKGGNTYVVINSNEEESEITEMA